MIRGTSCLDLGTLPVSDRQRPDWNRELPGVPWLAWPIAHPKRRESLPGRHSLSREFIVEHQRARIIAALAEETVEKGYRAVTVSDIVRRAGIARNTFYENFSSKEDCFLSASEYAVESALARVVDCRGKVRHLARARLPPASPPSSATWPPSRHSPAPASSRPSPPGPAAVERYERSIQTFVPFFQMGRKVSAKGEKLPETLEETIVGGIFWILYQRISWGRWSRSRGSWMSWSSSRSLRTLGAEAAKRAAAEAPAAIATG